MKFKYLATFLFAISCLESFAAGLGNELDENTFQQLLSSGCFGGVSAPTAVSPETEDLTVEEISALFARGGFEEPGAKGPFPKDFPAATREPVKLTIDQQQKLDDFLASTPNADEKEAFKRAFVDSLRQSSLRENIAYLEGDELQVYTQPFYASTGLQLYRHPVLGDGTCGYYAITGILPDKIGQAQDVRQEVSHHVTSQYDRNGRIKEFAPDLTALEELVMDNYEYMDVLKVDGKSKNILCRADLTAEVYEKNLEVYEYLDSCKSGLLNLIRRYDASNPTQTVRLLLTGQHFDLLQEWPYDFS